MGVGQCHAVERAGPGAAFRKAEASSASPIALADSVSTQGACSGAQRALVAAMPASPQDPTSTAVAVAGAGCPLSISLHRCCSHEGGWVGRWLPSHISLEAELSVEAAQHTLQACPAGSGLGSRHGQQRITSGVIPRPRIAGCTRKSLPLLLSLLLPVLPLPSAATAALTCRAAGHALLPRQPATKITSAAIAAPASTGRMGRPLLAVGCRQGKWQHIQRCTCKHGRPGGWCTTVNAASRRGGRRQPLRVGAAVRCEVVPDCRSHPTTRQKGHFARAQGSLRTLSRFASLQATNFVRIFLSSQS